MSDPDPDHLRVPRSRAPCGAAGAGLGPGLLAAGPLLRLLFGSTLALVLMPYYRPPIRGADPEVKWRRGCPKHWAGCPRCCPDSRLVGQGYWIETWASASSFWFGFLALVYGAL